MSAHQFEVEQGSARSIRVYLEDERGNTPPSILGTEALSAAVARGDGTASLASPTASWDAAASPRRAVLVGLSGAQTAALTPGSYWIYLTVGTATRRAASLSVLPGVGTISRPRTYVDSSEWRRLARPMLQGVGQAFDDGGIDRALAQATEDLDGVIAERYAASYEGTPDDASAARARMAGWLADDGLEVTSQVRRFVTFKAAWYLLAFTPGTKESGPSLAKVRETLAEESAAALRSLVAYVAAGDSRATIRVAMGGQIRAVR